MLMETMRSVNVAIICFSLFMVTFGRPQVPISFIHSPIVISKPRSTPIPRVIVAPTAAAPTLSPNVSITPPIGSKPHGNKAVSELLHAYPDLLRDPDILLDPDLAYPQIGHKLPEDEPQPQKTAAVPTPVGNYLGRAGLETPAFRQKCFRCCKVTKQTLLAALPWSVVKGCGTCKISYLPPSGNCPDGKFLGYYTTPTDCFYERCHRMLLKATHNCMCFWD